MISKNSSVLGFGIAVLGLVFLVYNNSVISKNPESYMFHVPNIGITKLQAEAIGIPLIQKRTDGKKEEELEDLKEAIIEAIRKYKIKGIVTGAIESVYQSSRIQKICNELGRELSKSGSLF